MSNKNKQAGPRIARILAYQAEAHLRNIESLVITPKTREAGMSSNGVKVNIGLLQLPKQATTKKPGRNKSTTEISMSGVKRETDLSSAGAE